MEGGGLFSANVWWPNHPTNAITNAPAAKNADSRANDRRHPPANAPKPDHELRHSTTKDATGTHPTRPGTYPTPGLDGHGRAIGRAIPHGIIRERSWAFLATS